VSRERVGRSRAAAPVGVGERSVRVAGTRII
jgi:hypothetical protein